MAVLASGSLSHRFIDDQRAEEGMNSYTREFDRQMDERVVKLWREGQFKEFCNMLPEYADYCYGEGNMHDTVMLLGMLGWDKYDGKVEFITELFPSSDVYKRQAYLNAGSVNARRDPLSFAEWRSLFRNRTMWGMMLGFSGINYTAWLYLAWLPGYLQTAYNLDLKSTGLMAAIPFLFGAAGMLVNGYVTDWLVKGGMAPIKSRKICIIAGMFCSAAFTLVVPQATTSMTCLLYTSRCV